MKESISRPDAETGALTAKVVCEIFVDSWYNNILFSYMTWREVLDSNIDCCTDETWEDWFEKYPDSVYDYCYQFHRTHRMLNY